MAIEKQPNSQERVEARSEAAKERIEQLAKSNEVGVESKEARVENARRETEQAIGPEAPASTEREKRAPSSAPAVRRGAISKKEKDQSFKKHIKTIQAEMSPGARTFSKIIHNKTIEKTSDLVGNTVARPDAILSGAIVAFIAVLGVYLIAKSLGYVLSGFETIAAFIIGWIIGLIYDWVKKATTGK